MNSKSSEEKNPHCDYCHSRSKSIFCDLESKALEELDENKVSNDYKKGSRLFIEGNPPLGLYCINEGKVKLSKIGPDGKESILRIAGPGQVIGHRSLFSNELYMGNATALENSRICFIGKKQIFDLIKENPSVSLKLIQAMGREMGEAEKKSTAHFQKSVRERLAELLLSLNESYGKKIGQRQLIDIKLTREEMASIIGTSTETVIRQMTDFKEEKLIEQEGKSIYILDLEALTEAANLPF
ncbi:MAG: Crp/Fnr family transcriptional regulator [Bacteriovoracaceae bacterium]|nr:Crp/Fnr family transcriptional regulator [Bacteriovoracaceae bacterium]